MKKIFTKKKKITKRHEENYYYYGDIDGINGVSTLGCQR